MNVGPSEEYGLGGDAKRLLIAAFRAKGTNQGRIFRLEYDQGGPEIRAGSLSEEGFVWQMALDELIEQGLVRHESGEAYILTPEGARLAAVYNAEDPGGK